MKEQKTVQETQGVKKVQKASVSYALEALKKHDPTPKHQKHSETCFQSHSVHGDHYKNLLHPET